MADKAAHSGAGPKGPPPAVPKKKKGKVSIVMIAIFAVVVLGMGGGGFFVYKRLAATRPAEGEEPKGFFERVFKRGSSEGDGTTPAAKPGAPMKIQIVEKPEMGVIPLEPFLVNLSDPDSQRFLRCTMKLIIDTKAHQAKILENEAVLAKIRDSFLVYMSTKMGEELITIDGKQKLRKELLDKANEIMGQPWALDLLFTDFVVQL